MKIIFCTKIVQSGKEPCWMRGYSDAAMLFHKVINTCVDKLTREKY
jgi:hypothetical protein